MKRMIATIATLMVLLAMLVPNGASGHGHHPVRLPVISAQQARAVVIASQERWVPEILIDQVRCVGTTRMSSFAVCKLHVYAPTVALPLPGGGFADSWSTYFRNVFLVQDVPYPYPGEIFGRLFVGETYGYTPG